MASLIDLRRRIRSVKNTQQITRAMKTVSASKLRRAQERVLAGRPYSSLLHDLLASVLSQLPEDSSVWSHPLLARREEERIALVLISGDKGLCGAFNSNVIRGAQRFLEERSAVQRELVLIGRKGRDFYRRRQAVIVGEWVQLFHRPIEFATAEEIGTGLIERFRAQEVDSVYLLHNEFKSVLAQRVVFERLLPIQAPESTRGNSIDYIYEQPPETIFRTLLPKYVKIRVYQALLESAAAEHAARMTAMDSATRNAGEMISKLTLHLNRVRQASITRELIEIVSGAEALH